ncbi:GNAT family N-acetyltransferase [Alistipes putredinis]|uniref:GNAT family N-acetyltransferase n=1 Tax=Alistipes putredinis TaxID=28117 RepID=UPI00242EA049|nr:GNAT family N-acetyltransferase [Alistipes putredinis]
MNKLKNTKKSAAFDRSSLIINLFREFPNNKFSLKHLASASGGATKEGRLRTREIITELLAQGTIEECGQEKYRLSGKERPRQEGIVQMISTGAMYIRSEEFENDVYVSQRNSLNALDGDRVEFVITRRSHAGSLEGEITRIVERSRKQYVGTADVSDHAIFVKMDPRRMPMDVYLSKRDNPNVQHGDKVVIRITDWALGSKSPAGELVEVLGRAGENNTEMHAILAEYGLPYHFEQKVEDAAQAIPSTITKADYAARRDFRKITTFTIDPADAKDFDDALSIRKIEDGVWEVGYCIGRAWWGKGCTTGALNALVEYWFKNTDSNWLACSHAVENPASGKVMMKAGFVYDHEAVYHKFDGTAIPCRCYALTREHYESLYSPNK